MSPKFYCRDVAVKFFLGAFRDAAAGLLRPKVALIALMDIVPFNRPVRLGLMRSGAFCISFDRKSKYDSDSHMTMLAGVYRPSSGQNVSFFLSKSQSKRVKEVAYNS